MYMYIYLSIVVEVEILVGILFVKMACSHTVWWTKYQVLKILELFEINIECNFSVCEHGNNFIILLLIFQSHQY